MSKSVKVRIASLNKDVTISRLSSKEIRSRFIEGSIPEGGEGDSAYSSLIRTVLATIEPCIPYFSTRIVPALMALDDTTLKIAVHDLYREVILANPSLDYMAAAIYTTPEPLPEDLERLIKLLPENLSDEVVEYVFRNSLSDRLMLDEQISIQQTYDVPDEAISFVNNTEMVLDLEKVRLLTTGLRERMVGQRHAIDHMTGVARRVAIGFRDPLRPPAVVMCVGPTGVGKTMLAKEMAELLFGKKSFGRIDCAQISERHGTSKLLGAPPGYVGYPTSKNPNAKESDLKKLDPALLYKETLGLEDGGILLFDEIEKADPDVLDVLLTAFDEGYVKTSVGNVVDLRNVVIILTSNLGSKELAFKSGKNSVGFSPGGDTPRDMMDISEIKETTMAAIKDWMKPELLSRISSVVPFTNLDLSDIKRVVDLEWEKSSIYVSERLDAKITLTDELKNHLAEKTIERGSGARYVGRLVDSYVVDTVAELYVEDDNVSKAKEILLDIKTDGSCDVVTASFDGHLFSHEVSMAMGD